MNALKTLTINGTTYKVAPIVPASSVTLLASKWVGDGDRYSQVVTVPGATARSKVDLQPTSEQLEEFHYKTLGFVAENEGGVVTVYAIGDKPKGDHTIQITLTEVEGAAKIRGNTVGTTMPRTDFNETDSAKASYLKGREKIVQTVNGVVPDENGNVEIDIPEPSVDILVDTTLTRSGQAADAKAVGDALKNVKPTDEQVTAAVAGYLAENPIETVSSWNNLKDKPFGEERTPEVLREYTALDGFAPLEDYGGLYGKETAYPGFDLVLGETYVVMWDDIAYECVAQDMSNMIEGAIGVGNLSTFPGGSGNGEAFAIGYIDGAAVFLDMNTENPKTSHEIGIGHNTTEVKTLDAKFLPEGTATETYVQQYVESYINEALGGEY